jgi:hypothetical protein
VRRHHRLWQRQESLPKPLPASSTHNGPDRGARPVSALLSWAPASTRPDRAREHLSQRSVLGLNRSQTEALFDESSSPSWAAITCRSSTPPACTYAWASRRYPSGLTSSSSMNSRRRPVLQAKCIDRIGDGAPASLSVHQPRPATIGNCAATSSGSTAVPARLGRLDMS